MQLISSEAIRRVLEERLRCGDWLPGAQIVESDLIDEFRVSRTPIRDALLQLSALGYVRIVPRQGIFVAKLTVKQVLATLEVLAHLEGLCAQLAAERASAADKRMLQRVHAQARAAADAGDSRRYAEFNRHFHEALYQGCRNEYLVEQIQQVRTRTAAYRLKRFETAAGLRRSWLSHDQLQQAVLDGQRDAAYEAAKHHITLGGEEFVELVRELPEELFEGGRATMPRGLNALPFWPAASMPDGRHTAVNEGKANDE